jgi:serine protease Do
MRVNNRILIVLCGLAAFATARVAAAADDNLPTDHPPVPAPTPTPAQQGSGGGVSGTVTVDGNDAVVIGGTVTPSQLAFENASDLNLTGNGTISFVATQPGAMARAAYLGLNTSSPDAALQKQLQLKAGVGLVVDTVEAGSPAEQAGVRQYDVLHKLDEQLMINTEQLGVLVRSYEPGKEVKLAVIREGKTETLTAKLGERAVPPMTLRLVTGRLANTTFQPQFEARNALVANGNVVVQSSGGKPQIGAAQITIDDGTRKLTISTAGGHKRMKGQDKSGKVIFDLPVESKEDLAKVAPEFRKLYQDFPELQPSTAPTTPAPTPTPQR